MEYQDKLARVEKVTNKGIHVRTFKTGKDIATPSKKTVFVSNKKIDEGKVYPSYQAGYLPSGLFFQK